ncbi:MAG: helix-turn-helix domain-containing protein [Vibrio sp.]
MYNYKSDVNQNKKPSLPWLGGEFSSLPTNLKLKLKNQLDIQNNPNNAVILTDKKIQIAIYYLNSTNYDNFNYAKIICRNLNKKMIIIHKKFVPDHIFNCSSILFRFNIDKAPLKELTSALEKYCQLEENNIIVNPITNIHPNQDIKCKVMHCLKFIDLNFTKPLKVENLASVCHCSVFYFSKQFRTLVGIPCRDYISLKRIEHAKLMLLNQPDEKISNIAFQCGFHDDAYFTRIFKKKVGMTPSKFRQKKLQRT